MKAALLNRRDILEITSQRGELITPVEEILEPSTIEKLREIPKLAIGQLAGRDSVAAILKALKRDDIKAILPVAIYTGTEYGKWEILFQSLKFIKNESKQRFDKEVLDLVLIGSPKFWHALNGRFIALLYKKFGFYTPCTACHLYFHTVCLPLAKSLGCSIIIAGDRESHNGKEKLNQTSIAIDSYERAVKGFGIELLEPLREVKENKEIEEMIGLVWKEGEDQLKCVLSGNYLDTQGNLQYQKDLLQRYFDEFALPSVNKILKKLLTGKNPDYVSIVKEIMNGLE